MARKCDQLLCRRSGKSKRCKGEIHPGASDKVPDLKMQILINLSFNSRSQRKNTDSKMRNITPGQIFNSFNISSALNNISSILMPLSFLSTHSGTPALSRYQFPKLLRKNLTSPGISHIQLRFLIHSQLHFFFLPGLPSHSIYELKPALWQ